MNPTPDRTRWDAVSELVGELAELPTDERAARVAAIDDPALRAEVASLLEAFDAGAALFERTAAAWAGFDGPLTADADPTDPSIRVGERLGAWRLVGVLGQGGMGAVYAAERDVGDFTQRAAIKMLRPDVLPGSTVQRFRLERQLLARLRHRNIATLLDGGVTPDGHPWFAMELVDGEPITTWCNSQKLSPEARVALFRQACAAVQHAHRELIVHRDLKPANILVTSDGNVKLLDFGIAKLLEPSPTDDPDDALTQVGATPATPSYASPEQLDGQPVSTASDIYSLGVVLYELLTSVRPFSIGTDPRIHRKRVLEEIPAPMASRINIESADTLSVWSAARQRRWLRGDIERVVQMALRKEPERRYGSAEQLATDLDNVLTGRPVAARPDGAAYRLRRFVGRNRIATAVTVVLAIGLLMSTAWAIDRARRAEHARVAATEAAARAEQVTAFLAGVLAAPDPWTGDRNVTVRELLDRASQQAATDFANEPAVEATVRLSLARSYRGLGRWIDAEREFRVGRALARRVGLASLQLDAERGLAEVVAELGDPIEARAWYDSAQYTASAANDSLSIAAVAADLAWLHGISGHSDSARIAAHTAVELRRRHGASPVDVANALNNLAVVELQAGRPDSAMGHMAEAVALLRQAGSTGEPPLAAALATLGGLYSDRGELERAETNYRESLALRRRIFGEGHPDEVGTLVNLAVNAVESGRAAHSLAITDTILGRITSGHLPPDHALVAAARSTRGRALNALGRFADALVELQQALAARRAALPPGHPSLAYTLLALGDAHAGSGDERAAIATITEAWQVLQAALGDQHPRTKAALAALERISAGASQPNQPRPNGRGGRGND